MKKAKLLLLIALLLSTFNAAKAVDVDVWVLNNASRVLTIVEKTTGNPIDLGEIDGYQYHISVEPGTYKLTMLEPDSITTIGSLEVIIEDSGTTNKIIRLYTGSVNVKNTHEDGTPWIEGTDYTVAVNLTGQKGEERVFTTGRDSSGKLTVLGSQADSFYGTATPSEEHKAEGYLEYSSQVVLTGNSSLKLTMPEAVISSVTVPVDATLQVGLKTSHFVDFTLFEPFNESVTGDKKTLSYKVQPSTTINYRTWREGGLTRAGYFTSAKDKSTSVDIEITDADYNAFDPKAYNHTVTANSGYETGDIFVNGNERGFIELTEGDVFKAHAMRSWELTNNSTGNYFMEPDFHYTVLGMDGAPLDGVIEITSKPGSAWADIKALAPGTAIVLVTYDAIGVNYFSNGTRNPYMGGEIWGAIWPENTAVYVVSVGQTLSEAMPNMIVNEEYNKDTFKLAGKYVDAEHDVFYYLDTEEGYPFTFTPEGVASVDISYPEIGVEMATYSGFTADGATKNEDGSWTVMLREGRQIVRLVDGNGNPTYQVLRARKCHRQITNASTPGSLIFQPGDKIKVQYSGLFHPANKMAGIYNMSAYITYNGVPNGTSLIQSASQYTFGSAPSAQAVTIDIPVDHNVDSVPEIHLSEGVIQVNGYGDPIGNHRLTDPEKGRNANFNAISHKTYFGSIPDVSVALSAYKSFFIKLALNVDDADVEVTFRDRVLTPNEEGLYEGSYGTYYLVAKKAGYYCTRTSFTINDDAEGLQIANIEMKKAPEGAWDGVTLTQPELADSAYIIKTGAELAWFANHINTCTDENIITNAVLNDDIELADYEWTPIGNTTSKPFTGVFDGNMHRVTGIYHNAPTSADQGFFCYVRENAIITSLAIEGIEYVGRYSGALVGDAQGNVLIDRCANYVTLINDDYGYCGGIVGNLNPGTKLTNSYNAGDVTCVTNGGGIGGMTRYTTIENVFNIGSITCKSNSAAYVGLLRNTESSNIFVAKEYDITAEYTVVTEEQLLSGELAHKLGEAFGQNIGVDRYPVINGAKVYKVDYVILDSGDAGETIYTNGSLPEKLDGEDVQWYTDADMTNPVTAVEADSELYAKLGKLSGINEINLDNNADERWYNIQGIEINSPARGTHGVFIRMVNGRSQKVVL